MTKDTGSFTYVSYPQSNQRLSADSKGNNPRGGRCNYEVINGKYYPISNHNLSVERQYKRTDNGLKVASIQPTIQFRQMK